MLKIGLILNYQNYQQTIICCLNLIKSGVDHVFIVDNGSTNDSVHGETLLDCEQLKVSLG